jgi:hypothetical protein
VAVELAALDAVDEVVGQDEPAQAQPGGERLAGGAGVGDAVGRESLHRPDRRPVVAVLGVVVVLDDERSPRPRPPQHGGVSTTLKDPAWHHTHVIRGDVARRSSG